MSKAIRAISAAVVASMFLVSTALAASDTTSRGDSYYEIWCIPDGGTAYLAKRVDAKAIQLDKDPGGKDTATEQFNANNPYGEYCFEGDLITP